MKYRQARQQECVRAIENALIPDDTWFDEEDVNGIVELLSQGQDESKDHQKPKTSSRSYLYTKDVKCLKILLSDEAFKSVHPECITLLDYLKSLQRFWRYQKPNTRKIPTKLYSSTTQNFNVKY
ncbi:hypothetical protein JTE90_008421 [Oedothorax gibbosus]|uniref:Uncharacterized protein n=1 Tax=Oedothorax gibbosus TaxID=931172 RepID=A0AAV6UTR1_9ARAC|nr:hypothetical protein JTE90_008421 [Oedothorax gibbosus]